MKLRHSHLNINVRGDIGPKSKIANTKNLLNSFLNKGKNVWNTIPVYIRNTSSIKNFNYPFIYGNRSHCYFMRFLLFVSYNTFESGTVHCISLYMYICLY